ncbi:hypothetical protein EVAR_90252_1 [Eumeta japonica]|uniref:Uncharacterized protein n=1 Tax=Eumeta variegata TaxID=151549 RepID=A0A4C2A251_EUMVA|nr:hypothetical protein EVAR_90252_1 [Eumeta japonica]
MESRHYSSEEDGETSPAAAATDSRELVFSDRPLIRNAYANSWKLVVVLSTGMIRRHPSWAVAAVSGAQLTPAKHLVVLFYYLYYL